MFHINNKYTGIIAVLQMKLTLERSSTNFLHKLQPVQRLNTQVEMEADMDVKLLNHRRKHDHFALNGQTRSRA